MGKRKQNGIDVVASMPWTAGIVLGLIGYLAIRYGIGWYFGSIGNPVLTGLGKAAASGIYAPIAWVLLVGCWIAALASFIGRARRRKLLDSQTGIDSLRTMSWQQFEQLTGDAFRRQGYAVEETGLGGADGGIDLLLRKGGQTTLVQCKQWRSRQIGVSIVREMYGVLMHEGAHALKIVALGNYTPDARCFADGKPIELIHGGELIATVRSVQTPKARAKGPMDSLLAFGGSMAAGLLAIAALPSATATPPSTTGMQAIITQPPVARPAIRNRYAAHPTQSPTARRATSATQQHQAVIYVSNSRNDAQLRMEETERRIHENFEKYDDENAIAIAEFAHAGIRDRR